MQSKLAVMRATALVWQAMSKTVNCVRCGYSDECRPVNGIEPALPGLWSTVQINPMGQRVRVFTLCPTCTLTMVHVATHEPPITVLPQLPAPDDDVAAELLPLDGVVSPA